MHETLETIMWLILISYVQYCETESMKSAGKDVSFEEGKKAQTFNWEFWGIQHKAIIVTILHIKRNIYGFKCIVYLN